MTANEIKKVLYKERPEAVYTGEPYDLIKCYRAQTSIGSIDFEVPYSEMGETTFGDTMPAQLLIRWLTAQ